MKHIIFSGYEVILTYQVLKEINPNIKIFANELIMRTPSYSLSDEEPDYFDICGRELWQYGVYLDLEERGLIKEEEIVEFNKLKETINPQYLSDLMNRREINKQAIYNTLNLYKDGVIDYWAIIECIEDGDVYLAERSTLNSVAIIITNKKTGEEIGSCPVMIETDATDDEVYEKLRDNDFYLTFLGIPIADSIEKLNAMEWRQDFYDYLQNDPSSFLSDLSNEDFDVDGLTVDDLSFTVK